jgi:hypothetical protein
MSKTYIGEKTAFSTNDVGKTGYPIHMWKILPIQKPIQNGSKILM